MMRVIVHHNSVAIKTYQFNTESITIGRLATNSIPINSMGISRHHLKIERNLSNGQMIAEDMGSLNGCFVNNQKIDKMAIQSNSNIIMGKYSLHIEFTDMPVAQHPVPNETPHMLTNSSTIDGAVTSEHPITITLDDTESTPRSEANFVFSSSAQSKLKSAPEVEELLPSTLSAVLIDLNRQVIYKINKTRMTFGSDKNADIFVESGVFSSDNLATLSVQDEAFTITKGNGKLKINDKKVSSHNLSHKDKVKIDNSEFSFMIKDS